MSQGKSKIIIICILRFLNGVFVSIWILKSDTLQAVFLWKQEVCHVLVVHTNSIFGFSNCLLLSCLKVLNPENLIWENYFLVFTKSVNSNFRAFLLVPLTIYPWLFTVWDRNQYGILFCDSFFGGKWISCTNNNHANHKIWFVGVYW